MTDIRAASESDIRAASEPDIRAASEPDIRAASELRKKYTHFRILVIGRANAGKTTILKRVCNTTEDPCFYDEENNALLEPTSEVIATLLLLGLANKQQFLFEQRGHHDINRPFAFKSNPNFIFHDSLGVEAGDGRQLEEVQAFIKERAEARNPRDQLHAIWFCFTPDASRFLLDLEERFFNEERAGNVPVIAIFTKFDDLINQVYSTELDENNNRQVAQDKLEKIKAPLFEDYQFPPKAGITLEDMHDDEGQHQEYVKELIQKTAESLDNLALKMLLVSVQKNNLELCIQYAVLYGNVFATSMRALVENAFIWFEHPYNKKTNYDTGELTFIQKNFDKILDDLDDYDLDDLLDKYSDIDDLDKLDKDKLEKIFDKIFLKFKLKKKSFGYTDDDFKNKSFGYADDDDDDDQQYNNALILIIQLFKKKFGTLLPSPSVYAALLICLATSFLYQSESRSFNDSFEIAFTTYMQSDIHSTISKSICTLEREGKSWESNYMKLVIDHHRIFSSSMIYNYL